MTADYFESHFHCGINRRELFVSEGWWEKQMISYYVERIKDLLDAKHFRIIIIMTSCILGLERHEFRIYDCQHTSKQWQVLHAISI